MTTVECLRRHTLLLDEQVNQGLHWLHLLVRDQLVVLSHSHKVDKAHVEDIMLVDMPEWVQPVGMVEMCVATEHLFHDSLAVFVEGLRETTRFANPLIPRSRAVWPSWGRPFWLINRLPNCSGSVLGGGSFWGTSDFLGREHDGVVDLADNPFLDAVDKLGGRDLRSTAVDKPGIGQAKDEIDR